LLDAALLRPGRFDVTIQLELPAEQERLEILRIHTAAMSLSEEVSLEKLAASTEGMNGAELQSICRRAVMTSIADSISSEPDKDFSPICVLPGHFTLAYSEVAASQQKNIRKAHLVE